MDVEQDFKSIKDFFRALERNGLPYTYQSLIQAGYYPVKLVNMSNWPSIHAWAIRQFTKEHYTWIGSTFWFETEKDAALFALKWG